MNTYSNGEAVKCCVIAGDLLFSNSYKWVGGVVESGDDDEGYMVIVRGTYVCGPFGLEDLRKVEPEYAI